MEQFLDLINKHGFSTVIIAAFAFGFIVNYKKNKVESSFWILPCVVCEFYAAIMFAYSSRGWFNISSSTIILPDLMFSIISLFNLDNCLKV